MIDLQTRNLTRLRVNNNNGVDLLGGLPTSTTAGLPAAGNAGRLYRVTDGVRGLWMDNGSFWWSLNAKRVNVSEFGAVGDGSTNDTTAIQNAVNAIDWAKGGMLQFEPGRTYLVTQITLPRVQQYDVYSHVLIQGYGALKARPARP